jgi:hypothetical protein
MEKNNLPIITVGASAVNLVLLFLSPSLIIFLGIGLFVLICGITGLVNIKKTHPPHSSFGIYLILVGFGLFILPFAYLFLQAIGDGLGSPF